MRTGWRAHRRTLPPLAGYRGACATKLPRRAKHAGAFLSAALAAATGEAGGDIPPQKAEDAACHQGQEGAAQRRADVEPHAGDASPSPNPYGAADGLSLRDAGKNGLKEAAGEIALSLLNSTDPMEIVNTILIPALDEVGSEFEAGKLFLPQLIQSAGAAQAAFEVIRERLSGQPGQGEDRGTIVLATVKGDIHDIGKNIVKVLLENYGYTVVDLGKDVDPAAVAEAVRKHRAPLVGLSALMTTTLKSMADTIALLHLEGLPCKIMVGGAVLTPEYASQIQADFYARDAKESVDIAKRVIG